MARPRVFVSSTYYDLKYIRSSLELFIESLGYEAVLSEKGSIAYTPDEPLDESCYREVQGSDIYVLVIGGRYGSEASETRTQVPKSFYDRYESVTKLEYKAALERDIPVYILIERSVYAEYQTYERNRDNASIRYAHVDSTNVFRFIAEILSKPRNNPIQTFEKYAEIQAWLRDQWAGLMREFLIKRSSQRQIATLTSQVAELAEVNTTLRRYLEEVISKVSPDASAAIITSESERLNEVHRKTQLATNPVYQYFEGDGLRLEAFENALRRGRSVPHFLEVLRAEGVSGALVRSIAEVLLRYEDARRDLVKGRTALGLPRWTVSSSKVVQSLEELCQSLPLVDPPRVDELTEEEE